nr:senescence-specific cysteine protease SAG39-like [Tanacetum cinerariifolium]
MGRLLLRLCRFMEACRVSSMKLLNFANGIATGIKIPKRLFKDLMPNIEVLFTDQELIKPNKDLETRSYTERLLSETSSYASHEQLIAHYGRVYEDASEQEQRFRIYQENVWYENVTAVPSSIDWRTKGAVTPIKDQGQCAVAAMEGITQLNSNGGLMDNAFDFIINNKGLATKSSYPYKGVDGTCNNNEESNHAATITGHEDAPFNSESALLKAVASQPGYVAIDASGSEFQFYFSGVFTEDKHLKFSVKNGSK